MATYTLFWHPRVSSLAPQAVLEEVSVDYDMRLKRSLLRRHCFLDPQPRCSAIHEAG